MSIHSIESDSIRQYVALYLEHLGELGDVLVGNLPHLGLLDKLRQLACRSLRLPPVLRSGQSQTNRRDGSQCQEVLMSTHHKRWGRCDTQDRHLDIV